MLCGARPLSLDEPAGRFRFRAYVGREFIGDAGTQEGIHAAMLQVVAWLGLAATPGGWRLLKPRVDPVPNILCEPALMAVRAHCADY